MSKMAAVIALSGAITLLAGSWAQAAPAPTGTAQTAAPKSVESTATAPKATGKYIILCYTCGGNYSRHVATGNLGGVNHVWEWGSGCGGNQTWRNDSIPYFCAH